MKGNWLTVIALILPAFRALRIVRIARVLHTARAARGLRLLRIVTSINRGMKALSASFARRGFRYVIALSGVVLLAGPGGIYAFENQVTGGLNSYGSALWWTTMLLTTIGSDYWPQTAEGRVLCFLLSLYGLGVFGYITAALASFFIGREPDSAGELAGARAITELREEIAALTSGSGRCALENVWLSGGIVQCLNELQVFRLLGLAAHQTAILKKPRRLA